MIITQKAIFVNPKKYNNWSMKKELNAEMAEKMVKIGLSSRGQRMSECSTRIEINYCPQCGKYEITKAKLCRDRLCPICSWRLSLKRYADMSIVCNELLSLYPQNKWSFMTLTVKNCASAELGEVLKAMSEAFNRMRQRKIFKEEIIGWARTIEVTFNKETKELHPHFHILLLWDNIESEKQHERNKIELLNYWQYSARNLITSNKGQNIEDIKTKDNDIEQADITGAVLETFKYTQKSSDLLSMPTKIFYDFAQNMANKKAVTFGGVIKEMLKKLKINPDFDTVPEVEAYTICKNCGSADLSNYLYKWSYAERSYLLDTEQ